MLVNSMSAAASLKKGIHFRKTISEAAFS